MGWLSSHASGKGDDSITSGIEGPWTANPIQWDNGYFDVLLGYEWELTKSPAGAHQWTPTAASNAVRAPAAHNSAATVPLMMTTADMAMRMDPAYEAISRRFHANPDEFAKAFAEAWYKLTHRDMGPYVRNLGAEVPASTRIWQDPVPMVDHPLVDAADVAALGAKVLASGLSISRLVKTAWASASTFRGSDMRGGANGARIRLAPQKDWAVNEPAELAKALTVLEGIQTAFNAGGKRISLADLIVLAGGVAVEAAAKAAGHTVTVPFTPGRTDATAEQTDVHSFAVLEPKADGFRNYLGNAPGRSAEEWLIDKAQLLTLTAPEMTVLVGGLRVLGGNHAGSSLGVFTDRPEVLSNDFFANLLAATTAMKWEPEDDDVFVAKDRTSGAAKWRGSRVDLIFGSHSQLRALAEVYASADASAKFVADFVKAWTKVMNADRFDLA